MAGASGDSVAALVNLTNAVNTGDDVALALASGAADIAAGGAGAAEPEVDRTKHPSGIVPVLQNVVATVNLGCKLDLKEIALHARNAEYNPKVPAGAGAARRPAALQRAFSVRHVQALGSTSGAFLRRSCAPRTAFFTEASCFGCSRVRGNVFR
jgi:hypothetical protein